MIPEVNGKRWHAARTLFLAYGCPWNVIAICPYNSELAVVFRGGNSVFGRYFTERRLSVYESHKRIGVNAYYFGEMDN